MENDFESFGHFVKSRNNETGEESFWYGQTLEDFDLTDKEAEKLTFLSLDTWTGADFAYVFGEICETHNSHRMATHINESIHNAMENSGMEFKPGSQELIFLKSLIINIVKGNHWDYLYKDETVWK
ncbi:hypothetical protein DW886_15330 [Enterocloster aldenensis]|uniref:hypothetical protein n=1 Tax=Enterocloster aldenensis TaxID=358742 RepID=UPI000E4BBEA6|nr:hypothetical protein DW886_15330 [Enterocloster aldenensis]